MTISINQIITEISETLNKKFKIGDIIYFNSNGIIQAEAKFEILSDRSLLLLEICSSGKVYQFYDKPYKKRISSYSPKDIKEFSRSPKTNW